MYEIITVDWNPEQTRIWRYWIAKHCPTAKVYTIPDTKPVPWCWSGGKLDCFLYGFKGNRVMYMDTDVIVTHDLEPVWDMMGDCKFAASSKIPLYRMERSKRVQINGIREHIDFKHSPIGWSSGMLMMKGYDPEALHEGWKGMMDFPPFQAGFKGHQMTEEFALSLFMAHEFEREEIWDIPLEVHGNIVGKRMFFGEATVPWVLHYHKPQRLKRHKLEAYLDV